jgi:hypothetical protein
MERFALKEITVKLFLAAIIVLLHAPEISGAASGCDGAGNCYIYAQATGSGNGSSWTNACTGFTGTCAASSMTRGVTYWVAAGSYGGVTFSAPASGTSVITIEAATATSHGPASDWNSSFAGQAVFSESSITTSYWTINGQSWSGSSCSGLGACGVDAAYNIYFLNASDGGGAALAVGPGTNYTIEYVDMQGTGTPSNWSTQNGNSDDGFVTNTNSGAATVNNVYVGYSYIHDVGADLVGSNEQASSTGNNGTGHTYEHDWFARNWHGNTGSSATHTQAMSECVSNFIVRYNVFYDTVEDGVIDVNVPGTCTMSNWYVYGNTIEWDNSVPSIRQALADGFLGFFGEVVSGVVQVYNNTFANVNLNIMFICGTSCGSSGTATITIYNNLFWNSGSSGGQGPAANWGCDSTCTSETPTADYNEGYCPSGGCQYGGGYSPSGSHDVESNTGNPFVNFDGSSNFNVSLVADTSAGLAVTNWSSTPSGCTSGVNCENADPLGITRGADGTIDRGAFQIGSGTAPSPPANVTAVAH